MHEGIGCPADGDEALQKALAIAAQHDWLRPYLSDMTPVMLAQRRSERGWRFTMRLVQRSAQIKGGPTPIDVVLKSFAAGESADVFTESIRGHQQALQHLGSRAVPEILSLHSETRSVVMRHVAARTAQDMLEMSALGVANADEILGACGRWLGRFHRATLHESRPIAPKVMVNWAARMQADAEDRSHDVPRRDLFVTYARKIPAMAEAARGAMTPIAMAHGDMHLRNLLITDAGAVGLDFEGCKTVSTAHDLAKFLVRYHGWFDADPDTRRLDAFWREYGHDLKAQAQPALSYILPIRLLGDWRDIPKRRKDRRSGQQHRFRHILKCAERVFAL